MRQLLSQLMYFALLIFSINLFGNLFFPVNVADKDLSRKFEDIRSGNYDCIFLGSSRTYRHIDPQVFDSITSTTSYNCGAASTFVPETYYVFETLLDDLKTRKHDVKTIVLEIQNVDLIDPRNACTAKGNYWLNNDYLELAIRSIWQTQESKPKKVLGSLTFFLGWAVNHLGFNYLSVWSGSESPTSIYELSGHLCLDKQVANGIDTKSLLERRESYLERPSVLEKRRKAWGLADSLRLSGSKEFSLAHFSKLTELAKKSEAQGIRVLFMLPPRLKTYTSIVPLMEQLGGNRCIDLSSPLAYPAFWSSDFAFDIGHLNCQGVQLFSVEMANCFMNLNNGQADRTEVSTLQ